MPESNATKYPECWDFFIKHARNISEEKDLVQLGKYRVPKPDGSGAFIYADCPRQLFVKLKDFWYAPNLNSPSVYGRVQAVIQRFS